MSRRLRAVVTGGGGFLGSAIVRMLLGEGADVTSFSRGRHATLAASGVTCHAGDLADAAAVRQALRDVDVVFHVAAKAGVCGAFADYRAVNVAGTANVIEACRRNGVPKLVFTSTASVVFGGQDLRNVAEDAPYARRHLTAYTATKAEAERLVLDANGPGLATIALRPHAVWGPGDNHLFPRIAARHRAGRFLLVGAGKNLIDTTYVDDAARAHVEAARRLEPGRSVAGRAYFLGQGDPRPLRDLLDALFRATGLGPVTRSIPVSLAYAMGSAIEIGYRVCRPRAEPPLTRFLVLLLARDQYFDLSAARRDLGYAPAVSVEDGMRRLAEEAARRAACASAVPTA